MKLLKHYKAYSLGLYAFLIFIHFVLKDRIFPLSIIFYAAPLILVIVLGCFAVLFFRKRKLIYVTILIIQCVLCYHWFGNYYFIQIPKIPPQTTSVLYWNVAKKEQLPLQPIIENSINNKSNIIAIVEASHVNSQDLINLKRKLPNHYFTKLKGEMLFGIRGSVDSINYKYVNKRYKFNHITTTLHNKQINILIVDIYASPFINKEQPLKEVLYYAKTKNIDIIVGDFNTPYESINFNNYAKAYSSFHSYSNGFSATWPHSVPLLELDQVWIKSPLKPFNLKTYKYKASDHKLLIAEYFRN